jgi:nucleoside-diphosphate kinase
MHYSFIMLKPDALERQLALTIIQRLKVKDIAIEIFDYRLVSEDLIFKHYSDVIAKFGDAFKEMATNAFVGKYVIPMIISSSDENIISIVRKAVGATDPFKAAPGTIRGDLGNDNMERATLEVRCCANLIHASDSYESYLAEAKLWFGQDALKYQNQK